MALTGDLGSIDLANVFQMLQMSQKAGTLEIRSRGARNEIYLDGDAVLYPFDRDAFPAKVLRLLTRSGRVTPEQVERAKASTGVLKRDVLSVLVSMRVLTEDDVVAAFREQMEEEVYELFADRDATFEFREDEEPRGQGKVIDARYRLTGNGLLMEAARRIDEWGYIREKVASDLCVFEAGGAAEQIPEDERDGAAVEVLGALDGMKPVRTIVEETGLTRFTVCKKLAYLANQRLAYEVPVDVLTERARKCLREHRAADGLALLERAFELGAKDPQVHEMAALAYQALERVGAACRHHAIVAEALERAGDRRAAAEVHLRIRDLMPTDVKSRERLVRHWLDDSEFFKQTKYDPERESIELVQILRELGREPDAIALLVEVQRRFPDDARLTWKLADLAVDAGDPKTAVTMLMSCADEALAQRQHSTALRLYRRVRSIDPQREGLDLRIDSCERATRPARAAKGGFARLVVATVVLAGAGIAFLAHNREAMARLAEIDSEELALAGDFSTALGTLDAFRSEHPATVAAFVAADRIRELESRRTNAEKDRLHRDDLLKAESERRQRAAERHYADAMQKLSGKELSAALTAFRRALDLANDPKWLDSVRPQQKAAEIEAYLSAAQTLFADLETARRATEWSRAHDLAVRLARERPDAPEAKGLAIPVRVTVDPPDATIDVEGVAGHCASGAILLLPAGHSAQVRCQRDGLYPLDAKITPDAAFEVALRLDRRPDGTLELPLAPLWPPVLVGARAFFPCENGRLLAVDAQSLAVEWVKPLPELEDFASPIEVDEQGLRVATRSGMVFWLNPGNGEEIARQRDVAAPVRAALTLTVELAGGRTLTGEPDGRINLRDATGAPVMTWRSPGPLKWACGLPDGSGLLGGGKLLVRVAAPAAPEFPGKSGPGGGR